MGVCDCVNKRNILGKGIKETTLRFALQRRIFCLKVGDKKEFISFLCLIHDINVSLQIESYSRY